MISFDNWDKIEHDYFAACKISCKPDEQCFPKVKTGTVIDEDKSVRWNREEVERLKTAREEEIKRLNRKKNKAINDATNQVVKLIAKELNTSTDKAQILWDFIYNKYHAFGEMFNHIDEYIDLILSMKE